MMEFWVVYIRFLKLLIAHTVLSRLHTLLAVSAILEAVRICQGGKMCLGPCCTEIDHASMKFFFWGSDLKQIILGDVKQNAGDDLILLNNTMPWAGSNNVA